jgi:hypothetical protein
MNKINYTLIFWTNWLTISCLFVIVFGLSLVVIPNFTIGIFSFIAYLDDNKISTYGSDQISYIKLAHSVIGSVMCGWGMVLLMITRTMFSCGYSVGWKIIMFSILAWFIPDTAYSLINGFVGNAVLNSLFLLIFIIPLVATYGKLKMKIICNKLTAQQGDAPEPASRAR